MLFAVDRILRSIEQYFRNSELEAGICDVNVEVDEVK